MIGLFDAGGNIMEQLTSEIRQVVACKAVKLLREQYAFPEMGAEMAAQIQVRLEQGGYDQIVESLIRYINATFHSNSISRGAKGDILCGNKTGTNFPIGDNLFYGAIACARRSLLKESQLFIPLRNSRA